MCLGSGLYHCPAPPQRFVQALDGSDPLPALAGLGDGVGAGGQWEGSVPVGRSV